MRGDGSSEVTGFLDKLVHAELTERCLDKIAEFIRAYFRIDVEGLNYIPESGNGLIVPNHSGYAAADAIMIAHLIHHDRGRVPKILVHRAFFRWFRLIRRLAIEFGLEEVSVKRGVELLKQDELVLLFPEGESGNFKPTSNRYHLQYFHTGFARMAIESKAPVIPCLVIGAEESHINLGTIDASHFFEGLKLPLPLNLVPLPSKWKIRFLEPFRLDCKSLPKTNDHAFTHELCSQLQSKMQSELNQELKQRKYVFFK